MYKYMLNISIFKRHVLECTCLKYIRGKNTDIVVCLNEFWYYDVCEPKKYKLEPWVYRYVIRLYI